MPKNPENVEAVSEGVPAPGLPIRVAANSIFVFPGGGRKEGEQVWRCRSCSATSAMQKAGCHSLHCYKMTTFQNRDLLIGAPHKALASPLSADSILKTLPRGIPSGRLQTASSIMTVTYMTIPWLTKLHEFRWKRPSPLLWTKS